MSGLEVVHCDNHLLVVAKPAGLPVAPDSSGDESLLEQGKAWLKREFAKPGEVFLGLVHRLDRPVSGVVCFARTSKAAGRLSAEFRGRGVRKLYRGVVEGEPGDREGFVEQWLWKDRERNRVTVVAEGRDGARLARTRWRCIRRGGGLGLVELEPQTGRSHQLRVACASMGWPLLGDLKYGARDALPDRSVALHARELEVVHPTSRVEMKFLVEVPEGEWWRVGRSG